MPKKQSLNSVRIRNSTAEFLTFAYQTGGDGVEVRVQDGAIWLSQKNIGQVFETTPENVLMHLKNIYAENELSETATAKEFLAVQTEGKRQVQRSILHYHLVAIALQTGRGKDLARLMTFAEARAANDTKLHDILARHGLEAICTKLPEPALSPLLQRILEEKTRRRQRLMALSYPEKVRIVEKMRAAVREIHAAAENPLVLYEEPPACGSRKP